MFISAPFLTSFTKLIPVAEESNLVNKVSLFSELFLEQLVKRRIKNENNRKRFNILKYDLIR
jgi:hypothetical protein